MSQNGRGGLTGAGALPSNSLEPFKTETAAQTLGAASLEQIGFEFQENTDFR
jgi:hypothetical protein